MSTITTSLFQNIFIFDSSKIKSCESLFSEEFSNSQSNWERAKFKQISATHFNSIESYYVDIKLSKNLDITKVSSCFEQIKKKIIQK